MLRQRQQRQQQQLLRHAPLAASTSSLLAARSSPYSSTLSSALSTRSYGGGGLGGSLLFGGLSSDWSPPPPPAPSTPSRSRLSDWDYYQYTREAHLQSSRGLSASAAGSLTGAAGGIGANLRRRSRSSVTFSSDPDYLNYA